MSDISYPTGCRPLTEDLGTDELIRRLKTLANTLQAMAQEDGLYQQYIPLALHLVDDYFLHHTSRDVQLLVACCIADVLRVYAPEAPYKDQEQIKTIFLFFIKQLYGLKDPKDPSFKRYFYLLENLAYVKSFNMCFEIEDCQTIFGELFSMIFRIINDAHSSKVRNFMIDILRPLITEADNFTMELLDLILMNIVEPQKSQNKYAYHLAEQLILKTSDSLEPIIKMFFNQVLIMDKIDKNLSISFKIYELIYELNVICPTLLYSILPQLECKLKSPSDDERLKATQLLARMFSEKHSQLSQKHQPLLRTFYGRFNDIAVVVRVKCVQSCMHFLLNHPHLRKDIIELLRARSHDSDEQVRYEVVMAVVETAKRDFHIVVESEDLLEFVRERTLDKKFKIRKEAMSGLALIYKQTICDANDLSDETKKSVEWIKNKVIHGYYMPGLEDRLLVERLLITCLVPYKLPPEERMKKLYHLLGTFDENATKAFIELQKNQMKTRKTVSDWVKLHHTKEMTPKLQTQLTINICKLLPEPHKAKEHILRFSASMRKDASLLRFMENILKRDVSCKECADTMSCVLKRLGNPVHTNPYYNTIKMLIERIASVMVDKESIAVLIRLIEKCMQRTKMVEEVGLTRSTAGEHGLKLLSVLSYVFSPHFFSDNTLRHMIALLSYDEDYAAPLILKSLTQLGRYKAIIDENPQILEELAPICKEFAISGTVKQAKHAVRCIFVNTQPVPSVDAPYGYALNQNNIEQIDNPYVHPIFNEIMDSLRTSLTPNCDNQRTKIATLGHIAFSMPKQFLTPIKNMIARRIVKELLIQAVPEQRDCELPEGEWCAEEDLPVDTLCKLEGLKAMARWLLGLRNDELAAQKTFRMLHAFINQRGDLLEQNRLCPAEKSWLRLGAACAMLKVCEQKGVGDQYSAEQYFQLSHLMFDPVVEVREIFARKLHKGLGKGLPNKCLPLDFMGYYALVGHETDKKLADVIRHFVETDVTRRREYLKTIATASPETASDAQTIHILPDFMLAFAIPVLAHDPAFTYDPAFTNHDERQQLKSMEKCLKFILDPLMAKRDAFSYSFYKNLIEMMKNHELTTATPDSNELNIKMWTLCDLAMYIINSKVSTVEQTMTNNVFNVQIRLPAMYYKLPANPNFRNTKIYIPAGMYDTLATTANMNASAAASAAGATSDAAKRVPARVPSACSSNESDSYQMKRTKNHLTSNENAPENSQQNSNIFDSVKSNDATEPPAKRVRAVRTAKS